MTTSEQPVDITLGRDEALILYEMLADFQNQPALEIGGPAERLALVRLHGALESTLLKPFMPDYRTLIEESRSKLAAQSGRD